ncbi:MAG: hypothetical protein WBD87_02575 [Candidatus Acidiferrales bacterium]
MNKLLHPYKGFRGSSFWKRVDRAILALVGNGDVRLTTRRAYVVAYICHALTHPPRKSKPRSR